MNMKSKFFGLNAKLALAVLAVGTMFTGCYDSENGDVTKPYQPLPAAYYVMGTITDAETGEALTNGVTVQVEGTSVTLTEGSYSTEVKRDPADPSVTVSVQHTDYNNGEVVVRKILLPEVKDGQSYTAVVNVALLKTPVTPPAEFTVDVKFSTTTNTEEKKITREEELGLQLVAEEYPETYTRTFELEAGYDFVMNPKEPTDDMLAYVKGYLGENYGNTEIKKLNVPFTFQIPAWNALNAIVVTYMYTTTTYTFTASSTDEVCTVMVNGITGYAFGTEFVPNHDGHYHGHGHGHGDAINAGGGILTPEM